MTRLAALLLLCACGPGEALFVTIEAPLDVPAQCDNLAITATEHDREVYQHVFPLTAPFPHTLTLTPTAREMSGGDVTVTVRALKGMAQSTAWSQGSAIATLRAGQLTPVTVKLCDCL